MWMIGSLMVIVATGKHCEVTASTVVQPVSGAALVFVATSLFKVWHDLNVAREPHETVFYV